MWADLRKGGNLKQIAQVLTQWRLNNKLWSTKKNRQPEAKLRVWMLQVSKTYRTTVYTQTFNRLAVLQELLMRKSNPIRYTHVLHATLVNYGWYTSFQKTSIHDITKVPLEWNALSYLTFGEVHMRSDAVTWSWYTRAGPDRPVQCPAQSLYTHTGHGSEGSIHVYSTVYRTNGQPNMQKNKERICNSWKRNSLTQICQLKILKTSWKLVRYVHFVV